MEKGLDLVCPLVDSQSLNDYEGQKIRIVGHVDNFTDGKLTLTACDGGRVSVDVQRGTQLPAAYVEVVGLVKGPGYVVGTEVFSYGDEFDMNLQKELVDLAQGPFAFMFHK